jgi:hypothetical protein
MILTLCADDGMGMLFNHRRQSQDRLLRERLLERSSNSLLWMSQYSGKQFASIEAPNLRVQEDFLAQAGEGDYCFVEDGDYLPYEDKIESILLYRWNRRYPADRTFSFPEGDWKLVESQDFAGSSHEKITEEVYKK